MIATISCSTKRWVTLKKKTSSLCALRSPLRLQSADDKPEPNAQKIPCQDLGFVTHSRPTRLHANHGTTIVEFYNAPQQCRLPSGAGTRGWTPRIGAQNPAVRLGTQGDADEHSERDASERSTQEYCWLGTFTSSP